MTECLSTFLRMPIQHLRTGFKKLSLLMTSFLCLHIPLIKAIAASLFYLIRGELISDLLVDFKTFLEDLFNMIA